MPKMTMWTWLVGLGAGTVFGVYLAQNYQIPNLADLFRKASDVAASYQNQPPPSTPPPSATSSSGQDNREK